MGRVTARFRVRIGFRVRVSLRVRVRVLTWYTHVAFGSVRVRPSKAARACAVRGRELRVRVRGWELRVRVRVRV